MKLTFSEKWFLFFGKPYLMNAKTGEVHFLPRKTAQCGIDNMAAHNKRYLSRSGYTKLMTTKPGKLLINGCRWCNKADDLE